MAQLRHDYSKFKALNTEILVLVPNGSNMIGKYIKANHTPYPILTDIGTKVAQQYSVDVKRTVPFFTVFTPTVFLVDKTGKIFYTNYSKSYISEPDNSEPLAILAKLTGMDNTA